MLFTRRCILAIFLVPTLARAGAWGPGSFENDDALDWAAKCAGSSGTKMISAALEIAGRTAYLEAPEASSAIAAAEIVAAARGKPLATLPEELRRWLQRQSQADIVGFTTIALNVVESIANSPGSELQELWKESKQYASWQRNMQDLLERLQ
jgi:hypothetical protein